MIGKFPGPLVEANAGDRIVVKVTNDMFHGTAIHWHGMFQNGNYRFSLSLFSIEGLCNSKGEKGG